ncbi:hypothetical protein [Streptomyces sp. DSM 15324]|uniref:hypothetical protein n=1 Tax=Streptomyces sp. DSM 15324 TaxID=1739111 RepID=UPI000746FF0F|nr:hypothetical protein [Streptomyces sp. DSM 15324]KUO10499.1 hypothetical protein AQJ58_19055 [Streptomyces sp. DSM 15324]
MTTVNRRLLALGAAVVVSLSVPASPAAADPGLTPPAAQAYDGDKPLTSTKAVSDYCAEHAGDCRFTVDRLASSEYNTAVKSIGNAIVNCGKKDIKVTRQVSLQVSSSDNLGGEITGQITIEGQLGASGSVTAGVSGEAGGNFKTPDQSKGPSAEVNAKGGANAGGTIGGSASLRAAFEGAFKLAYSKTWSTQQSESTSYETLVEPGDALVFGASAAMQRVAGSISTGGGLGIRNVFVDGPSSVNTSTFVADTFTVPGNTCQRLRPGSQTAVDNTVNAHTGTRSAVVPVVRELPEGSELVRRVELAGELS